MYHGGCFYDSWYKGCSYKNCVLVDNSSVVVCNSPNPKSSWNIIHLQKAWPSVANSLVKSLLWWPSFRYEAQTQVNSRRHLSWRTGEMSMNHKCSWVTRCTYLSAYSDHHVMRNTKENSAHSSWGLFRGKAPEMHRLRTISDNHFASV